MNNKHYIVFQSLPWPSMSQTQHYWESRGINTDIIGYAVVYGIN